MYHVTWKEIEAAVDLLVEEWSPMAHRGEIDSVWGVPRGGCTVAALVADPLAVEIVDEPGPRTLVVDDLVDSGATRSRYPLHHFAALFRKMLSPEGYGYREIEDWIVFPWEQFDGASGPEDAVVRLLQHIGEDPTREGLLDTPGRVIRAWSEITEGYAQDPAEVLSTTFDVGPADELVVVTGIQFDSMCEHHMLPFSGTVSVGYLPSGRVVGLSKIARLVEVFGRRLQVQERMTTQIAQSIMDHLGAEAAGVVIRGRHSCMACRGVKKPADMVTSAMLGKLRTDPAMRAEFFSLTNGGRHG